jgi:hypothetical protein
MMRQATRVDLRENLIGRLENWKFKQAKAYTRDISTKQRDVIEALATLWGDTGWARGGALADLIEYVVGSLVADIHQAPPADVPPETPP